MKDKHEQRLKEYRNLIDLFKKDIGKRKQKEVGDMINVHESVISRLFNGDKIMKEIYRKVEGEK